MSLLPRTTLRSDSEQERLDLILNSYVSIEGNCHYSDMRDYISFGRD
jgi:hypothetical protein